MSWYEIFDNSACVLRETRAIIQVILYVLARWHKIDEIYACVLTIISCLPIEFYLFPFIPRQFIYYFQFPTSNYWYMNTPFVVDSQRKTPLKEQYATECGSQKCSKHLKQKHQELSKYKSELSSNLSTSKLRFFLAKMA